MGNSDYTKSRISHQPVTNMICNLSLARFFVVMAVVIGLTAAMALPEPEAEAHRGYYPHNHHSNNYYGGYPGFYRGSYGGYGDNAFFGNRGYVHGYNGNNVFW